MTSQGTMSGIALASIYRLCCTALLRQSVQKCSGGSCLLLWKVWHLRLSFYRCKFARLIFHPSRLYYCKDDDDVFDSTSCLRTTQVFTSLAEHEEDYTRNLVYRVRMDALNKLRSSKSSGELIGKTHLSPGN